MVYPFASRECARHVLRHLPSVQLCVSAAGAAAAQVLVRRAALVIEVADSTLAFDTTHKASLYAAAKIADYWVVDLVEKRLLVFRNPQPDADQPFRAKYAAIQPLKSPASVSPLCLPHATIDVSELLP